MNSSSPLNLREDRRHGTDSFPCGYYETAPGIDSFTVALHWHEEPEIIYFGNGHFMVEVNMERYQIDSECFFFVRSGELHRIICKEPCQESAVVFSPYLLSFVTNDAAQSHIISPLTKKTLLLPRCVTPEHPAFSELLNEYRKLTSCLRVEEFFVPPALHEQLFIKAALLGMLGLLSRHHLLQTAKESGNENIESIKKVLSYIHEHYSEKIFIKDLARLLNLNEQYFCRFFKKAVGQSPISYLNSYRIRRATDLLTETELPVTDVCLECGFNNFGNFLREFRSQTGTTPLQYRIDIRSKKSK